MLIIQLLLAAASSIPALALQQKPLITQEADPGKEALISRSMLQLEAA